MERRCEHCGEVGVPFFSNRGLRLCEECYSADVRADREEEGEDLPWGPLEDEPLPWIPVETKENIPELIAGVIRASLEGVRQRRDRQIAWAYGEVRSTVGQDR